VVVSAESESLAARCLLEPQSDDALPCLILSFHLTQTSERPRQQRSEIGHSTSRTSMGCEENTSRLIVNILGRQLAISLGAESQTVSCDRDDNVLLHRAEIQVRKAKDVSAGPHQRQSNLSGNTILVLATDQSAMFGIILRYARTTMQSILANIPCT
jgi:hypothetical protein